MTRGAEVASWTPPVQRCLGRLSAAFEGSAYPFQWVASAGDKGAGGQPNSET